MAIIVPIFLSGKQKLRMEVNFQFLFSEMKLKPHNVYSSTVANCSRTVCAGRCFNRDDNFGVWCFPVKQRTWHVSPTGSDVFNNGIFAPLATIQLAVHYANDGDTILLAPGTYKGGSDCTSVEGDFHGVSKRRCNYNMIIWGKLPLMGGDATIDCELVNTRGFMFANGETWIRLKGYHKTARLRLRILFKYSRWIAEKPIISNIVIRGSSPL